MKITAINQATSLKKQNFKSNNIKISDDNLNSQNSKEPMVKVPLSTFKSMAMALVMVSALGASCEKPPIENPIIPTQDEPMDFTVNPTQIIMNNMIETLGLATVSTKDYSIGGGDIKKLEYIDTQQNRKTSLTLDKKNSTRDTLVYDGLYTVATNGNLVKESKRYVSARPDGSVFVSRINWEPGLWNEETGEFGVWDKDNPLNHIYEMQGDTLNVKKENENGEYEDGYKLSKNSPNSLYIHNPRATGVLSDFLIETQY